MSHIHIDVENLSYSYDGRRKVLDGITLHAAEEDAIGLIGANGAGKSTFLKLLTGLYLNYGGSIRIEEMPLERAMLGKIRERIGFVFQDADNQLFTSSVYEDVAFAPRNYGFPEEEVEKRTRAALEKTGIAHLASQAIYRLSGGEKKLASIATILSMTPDIILMDEPSAALDPRNRRNLIRILNEFDHLKIISSHDLDFVWDTCNRVILLKEGRIIADGVPEKILRDRELLESAGLELPLSLTGR